jgi:hypothetical protein
MVWLHWASLILAIAAAAVSAATVPAPQPSPLLLLPAAMAAIQLLVPANFWACLVAALWLLAFAALGVFSVGMFYLPAALAMLIAALRAAALAPAGRPVNRRLTGAVPLSVWISFGLALATSTAWLLHMFSKQVYRWPAYPFLAAPIFAAGLPLWWRRAESVGAAATLLAACAWFPITIEFGAWYTPALVPMIYALITASDPARRAAP